MKVRYGLISCDSHGQLDRDAFTSRMSQAKWRSRVPHIVEMRESELRQKSRNEIFRRGMEEEAGSEGGAREDRIVERWVIDGKLQSAGGVCNCPAAMGDPERRLHPQRWEEVPRKVYDPIERLKALDEDGVDGEVLFPNTPVAHGTFFYGDPEFELACVQAYNDALAQWREASERYIPLALVPFLSGIEVAVAEVERAVKRDHRGILMLGEPSAVLKGLRHLNDRYWDPLWATCQDLDVPVHWHASGHVRLSVPPWKGFSPNQLHAMFTTAVCSLPAQLIINLIFSGILERFPRLKWVCAETGLGWVNFVLEASDHEWEKRHLWTEGIMTRPSELFRQHVYVDFWYEVAGIEQRELIGLDNIMWESDYPHVTSTYPDSWKSVERTLNGVPEEERKKLLYENALRLYGL